METSSQTDWARDSVTRMKVGLHVDVLESTQSKSSTNVLVF